MTKVAVVKTTPKTIHEDIARVMDLADYDKYVSKNVETTIKLNLSWSKFYPACSTNPYTFDGVLKKLIGDGFVNRSIQAVENETVVTNIYEGTHKNNWYPVIKKHGIRFLPLIKANYVDVELPQDTLALEDTFGETIAPKEVFDTNIIHLPTIKCVHPDTEIFLADGSLVSIEEIVEEVHSLHDVIKTEDNDFVAVSNHDIITLSELGGMTKGIAYQFWRTPSPSTLFEVTTRTSRSVKVSSEHPFLTESGWKKASELKEGDRIATPRRINIKGESQKLPEVPSLNHSEIDLDSIEFTATRKYNSEIQRIMVERYLEGKHTTEIASELDVPTEAVRTTLHRYEIPLRKSFNWIQVPPQTSPDFWRWMGYFMAEGYTQVERGTVRFWWTNTNPQLRRHYVTLCKSLFGIEPKTKNNSFYFDSVHLGGFMEGIGLKKRITAATKDVPELLFRCPNEEIASFVAGYFDGDGTCAKDGLHVTSKSKRIIKRLQMLLLRLGVVSFQTEIEVPLPDKPDEIREYHKLSIYGDDVVAFANAVDLKKADKKNALRKHSERRMSSKRPSNWDTIPISPSMFRKVREGLGFTHESTGKPSSVNAIENGYSQPTRPIFEYFIDLFEKNDSDNKFSSEISAMKALASKDIVWDHVVSIEEIESDTPYLYDLSVEETNSFVGNGIVLHNTHGHTQMTGALKDSFGLYLTKNRHLAHLKIHEVLVDLLLLQKTISHSEFVVTDGTVVGDGAGPRTMEPKIGNLLIATHDMVSADAVQTRLMGIPQEKVKKLQIAEELGLGDASRDRIEIVGDFESWEDLPNLHLSTGKSPVIAWNRGFLKFPGMEQLIFRSPLMWLPIQLSGLYHDGIWLPLFGKKWVDWFLEETEWGELWKKYSEE
jgi:intein/homing endonuclease